MLFWCQIDVIINETETKEISVIDLTTVLLPILLFYWIEEKDAVYTFLFTIVWDASQAFSFIRNLLE